MKELEKANNGEFYNPNYNETLIKLRIKTQNLCYQYNKLSPKRTRKRKSILKKIINTIDDNYLLEQPIHIDYGINTTIGKNFYSNYNLTILDGAKVEFGDNCFIGPNCSIYTAIHPIDKKLRNKGLEKAKQVKIGNNVWFGGGVTVLPGITVGNNVVIGAGSVVTKDIPDNVVAAGNPCKIIRKIEEEEGNEK